MSNSKHTKDDWIRKIQAMLNKTTDNGASEAEAQTAMLMAQKLMAKHGLDMSDVEATDNEKEEKEIVEEFGNDSKITWWHKSLARVIADNFRCYYFLRSGHKVTRIVFMGVKEDAEIAKSIFKFASAQIEYHAKQYRKKRRKELEDLHLPKGFKKFDIDQVIDYAIEVGVPEYIVDAILNRYDKEPMKRKYLTVEIKKSLNISINGTAIRNDYIEGFLAGLDQKFKEQVEENKEEWGLVLVKDKDLVEKYEDMSKHFRTAKASRYSSLGDSKAFASGVKQGRQFQQVRGELN